MFFCGAAAARALLLSSPCLLQCIWNSPAGPVKKIRSRTSAVCRAGRISIGWRQRCRFCFGLHRMFFFRGCLIVHPGVVWCNHTATATTVAV